MPQSTTVDLGGDCYTTSVIGTTESYSAVEFAGIQGPIGPTGDTGPQGPQGISGAGFLSGSGLPSNLLGSDGDLYLDLVTGNVYGPKADDIWPTEPSGTLIPPTQRLVYTQASASDIWNITHGLGGQPVVSVVDTTGSVVLGDVTYVSNTQIVVSFSAPFAGYAYLT